MAVEIIKNFSYQRMTQISRKLLCIWFGDPATEVANALPSHGLSPHILHILYLLIYVKYILHILCSISKVYLLSHPLPPDIIPIPILSYFNFNYVSYHRTLFFPPHHPHHPYSRCICPPPFSSSPPGAPLSSPPTWCPPGSFSWYTLLSLSIKTLTAKGKHNLCKAKLILQSNTAFVHFMLSLITPQPHQL